MSDDLENIFGCWLGHRARPRWRSILIGALMLSVLTPAVHAQTTPPRPTAQITREGYFAATWPADFNENGITDLIGLDRIEGVGWELAVTFDPGGPSPVSRRVGISAVPIGTGDFNNDGHIDVVLTGVAI